MRTCHALAVFCILVVVLRMQSVAPAGACFTDLGEVPGGTASDPPLEDDPVIDLIIQEEDGRLVLVLTESETIRDPSERIVTLIERLHACMGYVVSEQFAVDNPDTPYENVMIRVVCATPPTRAIEELDYWVPPDRDEPLIPIEVTVHPGVEAGSPQPANAERGRQSDDEVEVLTLEDDGTLEKVRLYYGIYQGEPDTVREAIAAGVDLNQPDAFGTFPVQTAAEEGRTEILRILFEHGAVFPKSSKGGRKLWISAVRNGHLRTARVLVEHGVEVTLTDKIVAVVLRLWHFFTGTRYSSLPDWVP